MNLARFRKSANQKLHRVVGEFSSRFSTVITRFHQSLKNDKQKTWKPQLFAYRLLGGKANCLLPLFKGMDVDLKKSGMKVGFRPYVSLTLLATLIITFSTLFLVPSVTYFMFSTPLASSLLYGVGGSLLAGALTVIGFYIYPVYRADNIKRNLDDNMAFATGYLAILAGADVSPDSMFRSLSKVPQKLAVVDASRLIVQEVELFGADIITALENASKRTPSAKFKELLEGLVSTIHSGGDMVSYLLHKSRENMKFKRIALKKFSDTLGVLSEFYVTLLVAGPLIFVVMLSVMAMLGGADLGIMNPNLLLMLLTYIGIPVGSIVFIIILDMLTPKW